MLEQQREMTNGAKDEMIISFHKLQKHTDLNSIPSNWLSSTPLGNAHSLDGFKCKLKTTDQLSSFYLANHLIKYLSNVDVVCDAENIKTLLKLPYSDSVISMIVHKVGRSLLIDRLDLSTLLPSFADISRYDNKKLNPNVFLRRIIRDKILTQIETFPPLSHPPFLLSINGNEGSSTFCSDKETKLIDKQSGLKSDEELSSSPLISNSSVVISTGDIQEQNLVSKFLYHSLNETSEDESSNSSDFVDLNPVSKLNERNEITSYHDGIEGVLPANKSYVDVVYSNEDEQENKKTSQTLPFARNVIWEFEDIRMLIGSDMPIFGDDTHPSISLRLHNSDKKINVLTGLDYWLDNLICQVPEVLMCFHLDGVVQNYKMYKTENLPNLTPESKFCPKMVRDVAKNVLAFLQSNVTKEGHTYWLFKAKGDDIVKLYDLSSYTNISTEAWREMKNPGCESWNDETGNTRNGNDNIKCGGRQSTSQFKDAVSILLFKLAKNLMENPKIEAYEGDFENRRSILKLLQDCLLILDVEKFPHIAMSAHCMLSELFIPDDVNPIHPHFNSSTSAKTTTSHSLANTRKNESSGEILNKNDEENVKSISEEIFDDLTDPPAPAPPHMSHLDVEKRCCLVLHHTFTALNHLNHVDIIEKTREKARQWLERERVEINLNPYIAIPLPFHSSKKELKVTNWSNRKKDRRLRFCSEGSDINNEYHQSINNMDKDTEGRNVSKMLNTFQQIQKDVNYKVLFLFKKAFVAHFMLAEDAFDRGKFGQSLKLVKYAVNCFMVVSKLKTKDNNGSLKDGNVEVNALLSTAYQIASDSYLEFVKHWSTFLVTYQEEFNSPIFDEFDEKLINSNAFTLKSEKMDVCRALSNLCETYLEEEERDWLIKLPSDLGEALLLSYKCQQLSLSQSENERKSHQTIAALKRMGNICNELGSFFLNRVRDSNGGKERHSSTNEEELINISTKQMLNESKKYFHEGLECFKSVGDKLNQSLLNANLANLCRMEVAYVIIPKHVYYSKEEDERCREGITHYELAKKCLEKRKVNPQFYDQLNWNISIIFFGMAERQQSSTLAASDERGGGVTSLIDTGHKVIGCYKSALKYLDHDHFDDTRNLLRKGKAYMEIATTYQLMSSESVYHKQSTIHLPTYFSQVRSNYSTAINIFKHLKQFDQCLTCLIKQIHLIGQTISSHLLSNISTTETYEKQKKKINLKYIQNILNKLYVACLVPVVKECDALLNCDMVDKKIDVKILQTLVTCFREDVIFLLMKLIKFGLPNIFKNVENFDNLKVMYKNCLNKKDDYDDVSINTCKTLIKDVCEVIDDFH